MKKGLFFGVSIALLVAIMLISVAIWTATQDAKEARGPEKFKAMSLRTIESSVKDEKLAELAQNLGRRSLYYLDWQVRYSGKYPKDIESVFLDMLVLGRCRPVDFDADGKPDISKKEFVSFAGECFGKQGEGKCREFDINGDGTIDDKDGDCFETSSPAPDSFFAFNKTLAEASKERGFDFSLSVQRLNVLQEDPWNVKVNLAIALDISDFERTTGISRTSNIEADIPIDGLEDPLVGVESAKAGYFGKPGLKRVIEKSNLSYYVKNITGTIDENSRGEGWAYGRLADIGDSKSADKNHILRVKEATDQVARIADSYMGVIAENPPSVTATIAREANSRGGCTVICEYEIYEEVSGCLNCMRWSSEQCGLGSQVIGGGACPPLTPPRILEMTGRNKVAVPFLLGVSFIRADPVLFDSGRNGSLESLAPKSNAANASVWDIEGLRGFALCGGYAASTDSPDFLQRFRGEAKSKSQNGIKSMLTPSLAFGPDGKEPDWPISMADYMYYQDSKTPGISIKGMPGCKSQDECRGEWPGIFALDEKQRKELNAGGIVCGNLSSPC